MSKNDDLPELLPTDQSKKDVVEPTKKNKLDDDKNGLVTFFKSEADIPDLRAYEEAWFVYIETTLKSIEISPETKRFKESFKQNIYDEILPAFDRLVSAYSGKLLIISSNLATRPVMISVETTKIEEDIATRKFQTATIEPLSSDPKLVDMFNNNILAGINKDVSTVNKTDYFVYSFIEATFAPPTPEPKVVEITDDLKTLKI